MDLQGGPGKIIRGKLNHLQIAPLFFQPVAMKDWENASKLNEIQFSRNIHNLDALQDVWDSNNKVAWFDQIPGLQQREGFIKVALHIIGEAHPKRYQTPL